MKKNLMLFGMICMAAVFAGCSGAETTETEKNAETGNSGAKKEAAVKEGETEEYSVEQMKQRRMRKTASIQTAIVVF